MNAFGRKSLDCERPTLSELFTRWIEHRRDSFSERSVDCYKNWVEKHVLPRLGSRRIDEIRPAAVADLYQQLRKAGVSATPSTRRA
jgi:Phage integrase, N-terminal SAM-like domain